MRLDSGKYAFGRSLSLMWCSLMEVCALYITYWCSSLDRLPMVTSTSDEWVCTEQGGRSCKAIRAVAGPPNHYHQPEILRLGLAHKLQIGASVANED